MQEILECLRQFYNRDNNIDFILTGQLVTCTIIATRQGNLVINPWVAFIQAAIAAVVLYNATDGDAVDSPNVTGQAPRNETGGVIYEREPSVDDAGMIERDVTVIPTYSNWTVGDMVANVFLRREHAKWTMVNNALLAWAVRVFTPVTIDAILRAYASFTADAVHPTNFFVDALLHHLNVTLRMSGRDLLEHARRWERIESLIPHGTRPCAAFDILYQCAQRLADGGDGANMLSLLFEQKLRKAIKFSGYWPGVKLAYTREVIEKDTSFWPLSQYRVIAAVLETLIVRADIRPERRSRANLMRENLIANGMQENDGIVFIVDDAEMRGNLEF